MFDNTKPNVILLADYGEKFFLSKTLGPYKIAYELRQAGFEVVVLHHLHVFEFDELAHLLSNLISDKTLFVGVNSVFYRNGDAYDRKEFGAMLPQGKHLNSKLKQLVKDLGPNCKFVLGGPDARDAEYAKDFDYVVAGYADLSCINLANHLLSGTALEKSRRSIFGFTFVDDSKAEDFDFPASTMRYESHDAILPGETLIIEISRGCIFKCAFCSYPLNGKKKLDFIKYEELLYQEFLDNYTRFGVTRYMFSDDTFNDSKDKVEMIYRISKRLPFKLEYWAYVRLDLLTAHPDTIDLIFESGLRSVFFGIESFHPVASAAVGKGGDKEKQIQTLRYIKGKYGNTVALTGGFIFGLPGEDIASMNHTVDLLLQEDFPLDNYSIMPMTMLSIERSFMSKIEEDPVRYGYTLTGDIVDGAYADWTNQYTNYKEVKALAATSIIKASYKRNRISGPMVFKISGLGLDIDSKICKPSNQIDWNKLQEQKNIRTQEYKQKLYNELKIRAYKAI